MCTGAIDLREFIITKHANEAKNLAFLKTCYQVKLPKKLSHTADSWKNSFFRCSLKIIPLPKMIS